MHIAIIGTGISGLVAAYLLAPDHDLTLYEADSRLGGHTHTVDVRAPSGEYAIDTGFIVFNDWTYPNFIKLMDRLDVAWQYCDMSFGVRCDRTGLEYCATSLNALFAQRRNLIRPSFHHLIADILRFGRRAPDLLKSSDHTTTLGEYLLREGYSRSFIDQYLIPMGAAVWSSGTGPFQDFPARFLVEFFNNHGMLNVRHQPRWRVIRGGSRSYLGPLTQRYSERIRLNCPIEAVRRETGGVWVRPRGEREVKFDAVILACHSDQALRLLSDPSEAETSILSAMPYRENDTVLHTDAEILPRNRRAWASWNYRMSDGHTDRASVTYCMNRLQGLAAPETFCVTLNRAESLNPTAILRRMTYHHPVYTTAGVAARSRRAEISGVRNTWYCGAYWGYGFHEDGVNSALAACKDFGKRL